MQAQHSCLLWEPEVPWPETTGAVHSAAAGCCSRALAPTAERASGTTRSDAAVLATVHAAYASPKILGAEWPNAPGEDCLCTVSLWRRSHVWNQLFRGVGARHEGIWCATAPVCGVWLKLVSILSWSTKNCFRRRLPKFHLGTRRQACMFITSGFGMSLLLSHPMSGPPNWSSSLKKIGNG